MTPAVEEVKPSVDATPADRIVILTPGGPLLVDVRVTLNGEPLAAAWQEAMDAASSEETADAEADNDGEAADQEEKRPTRPLVLRSSRAYVPDPRASSRVWPLLDADANGRLSSAELAGAAERLWSRDANDDRVIALAELASLRDQVDGAAIGSAMPRPGGGAASPRLAALQLDAKSNIERLDFVLQDLYAPLQDLTAESFSDLPDLFGELDETGDDWVERDELSRLATIEPALELDVAFADGEATVTVRKHSKALEVLPNATPERVVLALGKTRLVVSAHDLAAAAVGMAESAPPADDAMATAAQQAQVGLMIHDRSDALFDALDANADGRLGEREIAAAPQRLHERDVDADGELAEGEAPYAMVVAFLRNEQPGAPPFTIPLATPRAKAEAAPPEWFSHADANADGDVSPREFLGSAEQFAAVDANGNRFIDAAEATATEQPDSQKSE